MRKNLVESRTMAAVFLLALSGFGVTKISGQISVIVSPDYSAIEHAESRSVTADATFGIDLIPPNQDDKLLMSYKLSAPIRLLVVDRRDVISENPQPKFLDNRILTRDGVLTLPPRPSEAGIGLAFVNEGTRAVDVSVIVYRLGRRDAKTVKDVKDYVEIPVRALSSAYRIPKFTVYVRPCGVSNAFSSPDVVICTELIADLIEKDLTGALFPILLHELGHSILNLWGLPGYDNEDIADEFAAVMLALVSPKYIDAYIKYFEQKDSVSEAALQLVGGSRHTISIQRARNMKAAMKNMSELQKRWNNLLKRFER